jgi:dTDP-4-dehydrorhamnose 3,5-epimerase
MKSTHLLIEGVKTIEPDIYYDSRGYFMSVFKKIDFNDNSFDIGDEENQSLSLKKGTIRGLHYQKKPYQQTKLVRVLSGSIMDIVVDLRKNSPTFLKHLGIFLSKENNKQLFIPNYMAHGFITLEDNTIVNYKVDNVFSLENNAGIIYNDCDLAIDWEGFINNSDFTLSEKDLKLPSVSETKDWF